MFNLKAKETQNKLLEIQPQMKAELVAGVEVFQQSVQTFYADYDNRLICITVSCIPLSVIIVSY